ncbi:MAG: CvpA family protein [Alphaproteobacteria bacterium]
MQMEIITAVDILILAIILISTVLAFMRGFVGVVLGLAGLVGAVFATIYGVPLIKPLFRDLIGIAMAADLVAVITVFIASYLVLSMVARFISGRVGDSGLSGLNRFLGAGLGALRGLVIVSALYLGVAWIWTADEQPDWLREARLIGVLETGAEILGWFAPEETTTVTTAPRPGAAAPGGEKGYKLEERQRLEQVIEDLN